MATKDQLMAEACRLAQESVENGWGGPCMSAIYWARLDAVHFACDLAATSAIGFDDAFQA